jgi:hypothetical protein
VVEGVVRGDVIVLDATVDASTCRTRTTCIIVGATGLVVVATGLIVVG